MFNVAAFTQVFANGFLSQYEAKITVAVLVVFLFLPSLMLVSSFRRLKVKEIHSVFAVQEERVSKEDTSE